MKYLTIGTLRMTCVKLEGSASVVETRTSKFSRFESCEDTQYVRVIGATRASKRGRIIQSLFAVPSAL